MGVIKRFAVSSIVLGTLAIAGGASALAFEAGDGSPAVQPADRPADQFAPVSDVPADSPADASDVPAEELPETGGPDPVWGWIAPHAR